jgi:hypothetical protein
VKCHQRSRQVKHLQHYKAGFCLQYARGFHPLPTLETDKIQIILTRHILRSKAVLANNLRANLR